MQALGRYKGETTALLGNLSNATNATNNDPENHSRHYLRTTDPFNIEELATLPHRAISNRTNAYVKAGQYTKLAKGLDSFLTDQCTSGLTDVTLTPGAPGDLPPDFFDNIKNFAYGGTTNSANIPAPRCNLQAPSKSLGGPPHQKTIYPHIRAQSGG